jgi:hypothetical protein
MAIRYLEQRRTTPSYELPPLRLRKHLALPPLPYLMEAMPDPWSPDVPTTVDGFVKALIWELAFTQQTGILLTLLAYM